MAEEIDYETFPYDSFVEIVDDNYEDTPEILHEENEENITEAETEITGITEKLKPYHSKIWEYFERISEEEGDNINNYITCNLCQLRLSANNSTTTLERHLRSKHKTDYDKYKSNSETKQLGYWNTELLQEKHKLFINWIITDQQPFTVVENKNFRKFLSSIQPRYKLPSRHTVKSMIMNKFKDAQKQINNYLQLSTSKISLTMDMWTSITSLGILAITIHLIKDNWQFDHFVLDVLYIPSPHNATAIKNAIVEVVTELKIENRLIGITSDNEVKMLAATREIKTALSLSEFQHYRCSAHILNLVVGAALNTSIIPASVKKLRTFISTVRNSPKQIDKLKEYFRIEEIKFKVPLPDCTTRWNYTFYMIDRALEIKPLLANLKSNLKTLNDNWPNDEEWEILTELANLLAPFASITKVISASNYPTIGEIKLLFAGLKAHLNKSRDDDYILQEQLNEMKRVFNNYFDEINKALHIPAFFDPRYKNLSYGNMNRYEILQPIQRVMSNYEESNITSPTQINTIQQTSRHQLANLSASETRSLFRNLLTTESDQTPQPVVNELDMYFDSNPPGDEIVPLEWWKNHAMEYPTLSKIAQDYLTIMSTSVPCEQFFSIAGKQITQTRNKMDPETARACLCLKSWLEQEKIE
jgi:hypothetical protein